MSSRVRFMTKQMLWAMAIACLASPLAAAPRQEDRAGLRLLVVGTEAEAADLRGRAAAGESFESLVRAHSLDPSSASGGYLGAFALGDLRSEFQVALRDLGPGGLSPVSRLGDGYFLLHWLSEEEANWMAAREDGLRALQSGLYPAAQQFFEVAVEEAEVFGDDDDRLGESLKDLAIAHGLQGHYAEALPLYRQSMAIRWATGAPADPPPDVAGMLEHFATLLSVAYFRDDEFDRTREDYETAIHRMTLTENLYTAMAGMLQAAELVPEAEMVLLRAVEAYPDSTLTRYALGELHAASGKADRALEVFEDANAIDRIPAEDSALDPLQRGLIYRRIGDMHVDLFQLDDALPAYLAALRLDPGNVETHLLLGELYLKRGEAGNALAELERALELDPAEARAHSGLGEVYLTMGGFAESVQAAERALDLDTADSRTRYIRARALVRLGMREEGRVEMVRYRELLANEEQDGQAGREVRAVTKRTAERFVGGEGREAIAALESLVETDPDQAIPRLNLGVAQRKSGLGQAAIDTFEAMVARGFGDAMVHRNLTMEYAALGDTEARDRHRATFFQRIDTTLTQLAN